MRSRTCEGAQGLFCEDGEGPMTQMLASCSCQAARPKMSTETVLECRGIKTIGERRVMPTSSKRL